MGRQKHKRDIMAAVARDGCQEGEGSQESCKLALGAQEVTQRVADAQEACYWAGRSIGGVAEGCSSIIEFHLAAAAQEGCQ